MFSSWWRKKDPSVAPAENTPAASSSQFGLRIVPNPQTKTTDVDTEQNSGVTASQPSRLVNIIFVHGLGGSSKGTWTNAGTGSFWPEWLPEKKGLENVRIATFGYDANWGNITAPSNALGIADFAMQLLDTLDLHYIDHGDTPTIFVAHSMGGLVVKKAIAIIEAHNDVAYSRIIKNVKGVVFLGTPHRGADLAKLLKNLLAAAFSQRTFVGQLGPNSEMITEINRAFRGRSVSLKLVSFYESTGVRGIGLIVPEPSATLGLPNEKSSGLNGNHMEIAKYPSKNDDNYVRVSGNIVKMVSTIREDERAIAVGT